MKFVFVVGPTGAGKTAWALAMAQKHNGSILNIDSVQFYKGLEIGSAAPSLSEHQQVPHHLYSYIEAPEEMTAGNYIRDFYKLIESESLKFPVFIVGGTGFYIQALEKGMYDILPIEKVNKDQIELELKQQGAEKMFAELTLADPKHGIHIHDHYRLARAIEILRYNKKTPSQLKQQSQLSLNKNAFPFPYIKIGFSLIKENASIKIHERAAKMIENGIIRETQQLLDKGFQNWAPLFSVGFKQVVDHLLHNNSRDELLKNIVSSTMKLIKKQKTWFKRDESILWSDFTADSLQQLEKHLDGFLAGIDRKPEAKG